MSPHEILLIIMAAFALLGAADRILGGKFGLAPEFERGILTLGELTLSMVGIICLAPILAKLLRPVIVPVYRFLGADPAMFAGTILACDMGGASLAMELSGSREAGLLGGLICGATLGATVVFTIPVALGILQKEDRPALAKGVLCGVITIPLGIFIGGVAAGFPLLMVLRNLIPVILIALLIALGLWKFEKGMIRGFTIFGKFVVAVATLGLALGIWEKLTGYAILPGMTPIGEGLSVAGEIALVLAGAFPLVRLLTKLLQKPLAKLGRLMGVGDTAAAGLIASLANSIATFSMVHDMDSRGKIVNIAFAVSAAFVFGDHLGFTAGFAPEMLLPVILAKLAGGISALLLALFLTRRQKEAAL